MFLRLYKYGKFLKSLFETNIRLIWGMWRLTKLPQPAITVFGSARTPFDNIHAKKACALAKKLTLDGFSIITGGGPGIMEAANKGAYEATLELGIKTKKGRTRRKTSFGIGLTRLTKESTKRPYVHDYITMEHFFARKWLLVRYSIGFIVFPGGFGTMDELFEVITLMQCERMKRFPIVLFEKAYWEPLRKLVQEKMLSRNLIGKRDEKIITAITNDVDEAYEVIKKHCKYID